ncbi:MAG: response regulator transcription factor [Fimbriimonadaceae bacterium]|nr:response regulator transcription factor [Fimbriimonadaceae bacterium]
MDSQRILVVEDDLEARLLIARILEASGFSTATASSAEDALSTVRAGNLSMVLLDVLMPDIDGFECCRRLREFAQIPLIMVSALTDTRSIVRGLEAGADDFITKPFDRDELIARVRSVLRRAERQAKMEPPLALPTVKIGPLHVDFSAQDAKIGPVDLNLSGKELHLLYLLAQNCGMLLSRGHIFKEVWRDDVYDDSKTLDVHISRLRKKLDVAGGYGVLLKTIRNRGYLLSSEVEVLPVPAAPPRD